jgi:hypothetical protein
VGNDDRAIGPDEIDQRRLRFRSTPKTPIHRSFTRRATRAPKLLLILERGSLLFKRDGVVADPS